MERELIERLSRMTEEFNKLGLDSINEKSLTDINDLINQLSELRTRTNSLYDEMRQFESLGDYNVDEVQEFYRAYFDFENEMERGFTGLGRRRTVIREFLAVLLREYREAQAEVDRINRDIRLNEEQLTYSRDRINTITRQLEYLNRVANSLDANNERAAERGNVISERDARYQRESLEREISKLETELDILNRRVPELEQELEALRNKLSETQEKVDGLGRDIEDYQKGRKVVQEETRTTQERDDTPSRDNDNGPSNDIDTSSSSDGSVDDQDKSVDDEYEIVSVTEKWIRKYSDGEAVDDEFPDLNPGEIRNIEIIDTDGVYDLYRVTIKRKKLVKKDIPEPPHTPEPPMPPEPPIIEDVDSDLGSLDKFVNEENKDMLQKFWGNREKHKKFVEAIKRIQDHIIVVDGHKTVEYYEGLESDLAFCRIEEFVERLERYTTPDGAAYVKLYNDMLEFDPDLIPEKEDGTKISVEEFTKICQADDALYISTNNQNYDKHKATAESIPTLGKYGEKQAYLSLERLSALEGPEKARAIFSNMAKASANVLYFIRNHTRVPISKFVGTYIAAPIHKLLMSSRYSSPYKDDRTHRFGERKALFEAISDQEFEEKWQERAEKRRAAGKSVRRPSAVMRGFKKAFGPRFKAMFKCAEGNMDVLASKANENRENAEALFAKKVQYRKSYCEALKAKEKFQTEITEVNEKLDGDITPEEKQELEEKREELMKSIDDCDRAMAFFSRPIGRVQNDAISMETHQKTNKENVTKVVTGVKLVGKVALLKYLVPKIMEKVITKKLIETTVPGHTDIVQVEGLTKEGLEKVTLQDMYDIIGKKDVLRHNVYGIGNKTVPMVDNPLARGFHIKYKGHNYSISDIDKVVNGHQLTTSGNYPMPNETGLFEAMAAAINRGGGPKVTKEQLIDEVLNSSDPNQALADLLGETDIWTSEIATGISRGWLNGSKAVPELLKMVTEIEKHYPPEVITEVIPVIETVFHPGYAVLTGLIGASALNDIYELARRTKSETEVQKELMKYAEKEIEKKIDELPDGPQKDAARAAFELRLQEEAKKIVSVFAKPGRDYQKADFTNGYKFTGKRKDLKHSSYNEAEFEQEPTSGRGL